MSIRPHLHAVTSALALAAAAGSTLPRGLQFKLDQEEGGHGIGNDTETIEGGGHDFVSVDGDARTRNHDRGAPRERDRGRGDDDDRGGGERGDELEELPAGFISVNGEGRDEVDDEGEEEIGAEGRRDDDRGADRGQRGGGEGGGAGAGEVEQTLLLLGYEPAKAKRYATSKDPDTRALVDDIIGRVTRAPRDRGEDRGDRGQRGGEQRQPQNGGELPEKLRGWTPQQIEELKKKVDPELYDTLISPMQARMDAIIEGMQQMARNMAQAVNEPQTAAVEKAFGEIAAAHPGLYGRSEASRSATQQDRYEQLIEIALTVRDNFAREGKKISGPEALKLAHQRILRISGGAGGGGEGGGNRQTLREGLQRRHNSRTVVPAGRGGGGGGGDPLAGARANIRAFMTGTHPTQRR